VRLGTLAQIAWLGALLFVAPFAAFADTTYQPRGDRWEGDRSEKTSGFRVELLSAMIRHAEKADPAADKFRMRFFLKDPHDKPDIVVRGVYKEPYYRLDRVTPASPWRRDTVNQYDWPTAAVVRPKQLAITDLGVVVRLQTEQASPIEIVAPAALFQTQPPQEIDRYWFAYGLLADAKDMKAQVFKDADLINPLWTRELGKRFAGTPIEVDWPVAAASTPEGWYRIVLEGFTGGTGTRVSHVARFYHTRSIR
jgi:hypothetical protein